MTTSVPAKFSTSDKERNVFHSIPGSPRGTVTIRDVATILEAIEQGKLEPELGQKAGGSATSSYWYPVLLDRVHGTSYRVKLVLPLEAELTYQETVSQNGDFSKFYTFGDQTPGEFNAALYRLIRCWNEKVKAIKQLEVATCNVRELYPGRGDSLFSVNATIRKGDVIRKWSDEAYHSAFRTPPDYPKRHCFSLDTLYASVRGDELLIGMNLLLCEPVFHSRQPPKKRKVTSEEQAAVEQQGTSAQAEAVDTTA